MSSRSSILLVFLLCIHLVGAAPLHVATHTTLTLRNQTFDTLLDLIYIPSVSTSASTTTATTTTNRSSLQTSSLVESAFEVVVEGCRFTKGHYGLAIDIGALLANASSSTRRTAEQTLPSLLTTPNREFELKLRVSVLVRQCTFEEGSMLWIGSNSSGPSRIGVGDNFTVPLWVDAVSAWTSPSPSAQPSQMLSLEVNVVIAGNTFDSSSSTSLSSSASSATLFVENIDSSFPSPSSALASAVLGAGPMKDLPPSKKWNVLLNVTENNFLTVRPISYPLLPLQVMAALRKVPLGESLFPPPAPFSIEGSMARKLSARTIVSSLVLASVIASKVVIQSNTFSSPLSTAYPSSADRAVVGLGTGTSHTIRMIWVVSTAPRSSDEAIIDVPFGAVVTLSDNAITVTAVGINSINAIYVETMIVVGEQKRAGDTLLNLLSVSGGTSTAPLVLGAFWSLCDNVVRITTTGQTAAGFFFKKGVSILGPGSGFIISGNSVNVAARFNSYGIWIAGSLNVDLTSATAIPTSLLFGIIAGNNSSQAVDVVSFSTKGERLLLLSALAQQQGTPAVLFRSSSDSGVLLLGNTIAVEGDQYLAAMRVTGVEVVDTDYTRKLASLFGSGVASGVGGAFRPDGAGYPLVAVALNTLRATVSNDGSSAFGFFSVGGSLKLSGDAMVQFQHNTIRVLTTTSASSRCTGVFWTISSGALFSVRSEFQMRFNDVKVWGASQLSGLYIRFDSSGSGPNLPAVRVEDWSVFSVAENSIVVESRKGAREITGTTLVFPLTSLRTHSLLSIADNYIAVDGLRAVALTLSMKLRVQRDEETNTSSSSSSFCPVAPTSGDATAAVEIRSNILRVEDSINGLFGSALVLPLFVEVETISLPTPPLAVPTNGTTAICPVDVPPPLVQVFNNSCLVGWSSDNLLASYVPRVQADPVIQLLVAAMTPLSSSTLAAFAVDTSSNVSVVQLVSNQIDLRWSPATGSVVSENGLRMALVDEAEAASPSSPSTAWSWFSPMSLCTATPAIQRYPPMQLEIGCLKRFATGAASTSISSADTMDLTGKLYDEINTATTVSVLLTAEELKVTTSHWDALTNATASCSASPFLVVNTTQWQTNATACDSLQSPCGKGLRSGSLISPTCSPVASTNPPASQSTSTPTPQLQPPGVGSNSTNVTFAPPPLGGGNATSAPNSTTVNATFAPPPLQQQDATLSCECHCTSFELKSGSIVSWQGIRCDQRPVLTIPTPTLSASITKPSVTQTHTKSRTKSLTYNTLTNERTNTMTASRSKPSATSSRSFHPTASREKTTTNTIPVPLSPLPRGPYSAETCIWLTSVTVLDSWARGVQFAVVAMAFNLISAPFFAPAVVWFLRLEAIVSTWRCRPDDGEPIEPYTIPRWFEFPIQAQQPDSESAATGTNGDPPFDHYATSALSTAVVFLVIPCATLAGLGSSFSKGRVMRRNIATVLSPLVGITVMYELPCMVKAACAIYPRSNAGYPIIIAVILLLLGAALLGVVVWLSWSKIPETVALLAEARRREPRQRVPHTATTSPNTPQPAPEPPTLTTVQQPLLLQDEDQLSDDVAAAVVTLQEEERQKGLLLLREGARQERLKESVIDSGGAAQLLAMVTGLVRGTRIAEAAESNPLMKLVFIEELLFTAALMALTAMPSPGSSCTAVTSTQLELCLLHIGYQLGVRPYVEFGHTVLHVTAGILLLLTSLVTMLFQMFPLESQDWAPLMVRSPHGSVRRDLELLLGMMVLVQYFFFAVASVLLVILWRRKRKQIHLAERKLQARREEAIHVLSEEMEEMREVAHAKRVQDAFEVPMIHGGVGISQGAATAHLLPHRTSSVHHTDVPVTHTRSISPRSEEKSGSGFAAHRRTTRTGADTTNQDNPQNSDDAACTRQQQEPHPSQPSNDGSWYSGQSIGVLERFMTTRFDAERHREYAAQFVPRHMHSASSLPSRRAFNTQKDQLADDEYDVLLDVPTEGNPLSPQHGRSSLARTTKHAATVEHEADCDLPLDDDQLKSLL